MGSFHWRAVPVESTSDVKKFAADLETALNQLEEEKFEVQEVIKPALRRETGLVILGRKPRRFPATGGPAG
jgi:hypothetical protein